MLNMKLMFGVTLILLSMAIIKSSHSSEEDDKIVEDCRVQSNAPEDDVKAMLNHVIPTTKTAKCFNACVLNAFGISHSSEEDDKIVEDCRVQSNAPEDDVKAMLNHVIPTTKTAKCFNACVLNAFGISHSSEEDDKIVEDCRVQSNAPEDDVKAMLNHVIPTTKTAKCFNACVLNAFGIMKVEKFVPSQLKTLAEMSDGKIKGNDGKTLLEVTKDIAEECKEVSDPDKCESAAKLIICLNAGAKKRGFDPNTF